MLALFRDGFYKDFTVLMLVTIILGTLFATGVAWAVDSYFGDTVNEMLGESGQYDLILHIREESRAAAMRELERIASEQFPGAQVNASFTIAGQLNVFFGFPEEFKTREILENLASIFTAVPGLNSYTVVLEPSVLIRGVHASVRQELRQQVEQIPGVKFAFRDGDNMLILLDSMEYSKTVGDEVKKILSQYQILEVRFPMGMEVDTQQYAQQTIRALRRQYAGIEAHNVTSGEQGSDLDAFVKTLTEMRDFLLSYASKVTIAAKPNSGLIVGEQVVVGGVEELELQPDSPVSRDAVVVEILSVEGSTAEAMIVEGSISEATDVLTRSGYRLKSGRVVGEQVGQVKLTNERHRLTYTINESLRLLGELEELADQAQTAVENADGIMATFQEALMQLEVLQIQIGQLAEGLGQEEGQSPGEQILVSLLVNGLLRGLTQAAAGENGEPSLESLENMDVKFMQESLKGISEQISNVQDIDVNAIIDQISLIRDGLPQLEDAEIGKSIRLINSYISGQVIPGERVQILLRNSPIDEKDAEPVIRQELDNPYLNTYSVSVGMVNPDARTELFRVLSEVRATIAGLMAVVFTLIVMILDHATIFSTLKWMRRNRKPAQTRLRRLFNPIYLFGSLVSMGMLLAIYQLGRAEIPLTEPWMVGFVGLLLGWLTVFLAEKLSPVHSHEIMAGQALGLTNVQIMREIVVPASRPGLLNLINRWKQQF